MSEISFSDMFEEPAPEAEPEPQREWTSPAWFGPRDDELPVCVPLALVSRGRRTR